MVIHDLGRNEYKINPEDLEDLIHLRVLLHRGSVETSRKVYKKEEHKVKRKQEVEIQTVLLDRVGVRLGLNHLVLSGESSKGVRTLKIHCGDTFILRKTFSLPQTQILRNLKRKKVLYFAVDCNSLTVGEIHLNKFKTLSKQHYTLKEEDFDLNSLVRSTNLKLQSVYPVYAKVIFKTLPSLRDLLPPEIPWSPLHKDVLEDWRDESVYGAVYDSMLQESVRCRNKRVDSLEDILQAMEVGNVDKIYFTENVEDVILDSILERSLERKIRYLPKASTVNWMGPHGCVLFRYF